MTSEAQAPTVLLTTNDPNQAAQAMALLLHSLGRAHVVIVGYGPQAQLAVVAAGKAAEPGPGVKGTAVVLTDCNSREAAVNHALAECYSGGVLVIMDQDVRVCPGWLQELGACLNPGKVHGLGERIMDGYDRIGMVAPCTDQARSPAQRVGLSEGDANMGLVHYAAARLGHFAGSVSAANVVDGCCVLLTQAAVQAVGGQLLDPSLGAWAWQDLCLRLADARYRVAVSEGAYVGRTTEVGLGDEHVGSVVERLQFYAKHPAPDNHRLIAMVVAPLRSWQGLMLLRATLRRVALLADGVAVVVGSNPLDLQHDPEYQAALKAKRVGSVDTALLKRSSGQGAEGVAQAMDRWVRKVMDVPGRKVGKLSTEVVIWDGSGDMRQQRNKCLRMAEGLGATAVLALDADEVLDAQVQRWHLDRMLSHPNPLASAWDFGVAYHWDAPTLVREDGAWGHGGKYTGGPHSVRLHRLRRGRAGLVLAGNGAGMLPDVDPSRQRVGNITARRFRAARPADREHLELGSTEGMRLSGYTGDNRIGLHCLVYEGEDPEDVARWLDQVHGLVDRVVLVWTGAWGLGDRPWERDAEQLGAEAWPATGPGRELALVAHLHGCQWVHQPLDDDFAKARNAGIEALHAHGMRWAWFIDPDEWFANSLQDATALRNMAGSDRWGWLVQVVNYRADKEVPTISDSVRISRLDPDGIMRMDGRVHEGFSMAIHTLQDQGKHPRLVYAPFMLQQRGLALDAERMDAKLRHYDHLLRLELGERPHSPGAWVSLGWHYFNDGHPEQGLECYNRALACAGTSYLPFKEMAYHHLREATRLMDECDKRLVAGHQFYDLAQAMRKWLHRYAPPHPVIPRLEQREAEPLPEWSAPALPALPVLSGYDAT